MPTVNAKYPLSESNNYQYFLIVISHHSVPQGLIICFDYRIVTTIEHALLKTIAGSRQDLRFLYVIPFGNKDEALKMAQAKYALAPFYDRGSNLSRRLDISSADQGLPRRWHHQEGLAGCDKLRPEAGRIQGLAGRRIACPEGTSMNRVALIIGVGLLLFANSTSAQTASTKSKTVTDKSTAEAKAEAERARQARQEQARALLFALSGDARDFHDQRLRIISLARIADALWDVAAEQGRALFREAWEAAQKADREAAGNLNLSGIVLRLAAKRDRLLAD